MNKWVVNIGAFELIFIAAIGGLIVLAVIAVVVMLSKNKSEPPR